MPITITRKLPSSKLLNEVSTCIIANQSLYFFGGLDIPKDCNDHDLHMEYVTKEVYGYELSKVIAKEKRSTIRCESMISGMSQPLVVQVNDCLYVLGNGKDEFNDELEPCFQVYDLKRNQWTRLNENLIDIKSCDCNDWTRDNLGTITHVVIGHKLHVSIGNSSFTFDTKKRVWKESKLFEFFWTSNVTRKSSLSPSNFYGSMIWDGAANIKKKINSLPTFGSHGSSRICNMVVKRNRNKFGGGPPFAFYGKGIIWDDNILLGVHYSPTYLLVAFMLDDNGRVVRSQPIIGVCTSSDGASRGANLVDLGEDGYFGLVHTRPEPDGDDYFDFALELVIFQVEKLAGPYDDTFLKCEVKSKNFITGGLGDIGRYYTASCV